MELSKIFNQFPLFHQWMKDKKLNPKDLSILTEFETLFPIKPLLQWIEKRQPTHSQGKQILDLGGELLLMDKAFNSLLLKETTAPQLIEGLKKLRLAETSFRDEKKSDIVNRLAWTDSIKAKWIRQDDRGALSVHFHSFSLKDFKQKIQKLNSVYQQLSEGPGKLWKN